MANGTKKAKSKKKVIIFSIIGVVVLALVLLVVLGSKRETIITVQTEKIEKRTLTQVVSATGKIQPELQVKINAEVSGEIIALPVKEGQKVKKGDLLVKVKPDTYIAQRDQQRAMLVVAEANLTKIESDYNRAKGLFDKKLISDQELEAAKTNYSVQKAQWQSAKAALNQAEESLRKTTISSPLDGTVSNLISRLGERVSGSSFMQGTEIMTVADLRSMEAQVDIDENDIVLVKIGDTSRITVDAYPAKKLNAVVYEIGNAAKTKGLGTQEEVVNFQVKIRIVDKGIELRPGMSVTADTETDTRNNVLSAPIQSVTTRMPKMEQKPEEGQAEGVVVNNGKKKEETKIDEVIFLNDNGKAKMVKVKRGISDDSYVEITEGVAGGEEVISGSFKAINRELEEGSKLKVDNQPKKFASTTK
jgi:HlyD family secretion protein